MDDGGGPVDSGIRLVMPEFTRSLRAFASVRAVGTLEHDLVFGPFIAARRSAARVLAPEARAAAFDADRLRRGLMDAIAAIAKDRAGADAPRRRACEATLEEAAVPTLRALDAVRAAATSLRAAPVSARAANWDTWCRTVQDLFNAADLFFLSLDTVALRARGAGGSRWRGQALGLALGLALACVAGTSVLHAQHVTLRIAGARADSLTAAGFDVVGVESGAVLVVADPRDRARLGARGLQATELPARRSLASANAATATVVYRSYDDPVRGIRAWTDSIVRVNPRVSVDTIGKSFEGRPMLMLKIGAKDDSPQRPNVVFLATYHAREWVATEMALRLAAYLAAPPGTDARRDSLVQSRDIWIMPVANPDGYQYTFSSDRLWRKTRSPQLGGAIGVDMNRNHSYHWGLDDQGSSPDPQSAIFRGAAAASEIEIRNIEAWHTAHPPAIALSYHTFSGLLLYPPGSSYGVLPADLPVYQTLAGTNFRSAVTDRLPASGRTMYQPGPGWMLYTTNGEYTDFASSRFASLAFTAELTSGYNGDAYYGFEFVDDAAQIDRVFQDNLPFALDLLDAARKPAAFVSNSTGRATRRISVESVSPDIRATVPSADAAGAAISASGPVAFRLDSTAGGRYAKRVVSALVTRPAAFSITAGGTSASFRVLTIAGAEKTDAAWAMTGFAIDSTITKSGRFSWFGTTGSLTTPAVVVPAGTDTLSLAYWTFHSGSGFTPEPSGRIDASTDGGTTWSTVGIQRGFAPAWYTDGVTVGGVGGKTVAFRFVANGMPWRLDEVAIVAHGAVTTAATTVTAQLLPSENPVRSSAVRFTWPFGTASGDIAVFDFSGREIWRKTVSAGESVTWGVQASGVVNGAYIAVAKSASKTSRLKLFIARRAP
ncbi:MAG: M14 family zinc carboxypeptidase [Gemmatimonadetes bacterium]|nr:M14 family zinc carboxypeptidase [Gemmatimonadota bacterium]